jgi:WD40 repeat protein
MVAAVVFFTSGRHFASVSMEHVVNVWDVSSPEPIVTLSGNSDDVFTSVVVVPGRGWLLGGLADGRIRVWDYCGGTVGP